MLKWLILLDDLVLILFAVLVAFISKFVNLFEIEIELTIIAVICFSQFAFLGTQFVYVVKDRLPDKEVAKRMGYLFIIKIPVAFFTSALILSVIFLFVPVHSEAAFDKELTVRYNEAQGKPNAYLDAMHEAYNCCGVGGQKFDAHNPTVFNPAKGLAVKLPRSCCGKLNETNECNYWNIRPVTCSSAHAKMVYSFKMVVPILFGVSLLFKVFMHFAYKNNSDSLFA